MEVGEEYSQVLSTSCVVVVSLVAITVAYWLYAKWSRRTPVPVPDNTVCLYQVGRGPWAPSVSPFPLKLETFLRMAQIPYMNDHSHRMSRKGKTPWMSLNGEEVADSQFCIEHLKQNFQLDLNESLTSEQRGIARAARVMTEENLYWTCCHESFVKNPGSIDLLLKDIMGPARIFLFKKAVGLVLRLEMWGHGIGRHTDTEVWEIGKRDLHALADILGDKLFMLGDEPSETDCSVFSMLAMIVWQMKGSRHEKFVHESLPTLVDYCCRMRDRYWPDWNLRCEGEAYTGDNHRLYTFPLEVK